MVNECNYLWEKCLSVIRDNVSETAFNTWFKPIEPLMYEDHKFTIKVPSQFFYEYLEEKYINLLQATLYRIVGEGTLLNYLVVVDQSSGEEAEGSITYPSDKSDKNVKITPKNANKAPQPFTPVVQDIDPQLNPKYTFDNFFEGNSNKLARTASLSVAQNPGNTSFNPLFVYGPSGVGKTHLCHAIGMKVRELFPEKRVLYISAHLFKVQFTDSIRKNTSNDFLNFYQNIDVLLIDDIHELIGMERTQDTFFHIFNHLHQLGKQLVLTSDKSPVDLQGMKERMITRLKWGLTAEITRPDLTLRKQILRKKIEHDSINVPDEIIDFIAENATENIRDLEGILVSLMANAIAFNKDIDMSLAKRVVSQAVRLEQKPITIPSIQDTVCKYYNLSQSLLLSKSRKREIVQARQITMYLAKKYTDNSYALIGKIIGQKDHATVLHACKTVKDQMEINKSFRSAIESIEEQIKG